MKGTVDVTVRKTADDRYTVEGRFSQLPVMEVTCSGIPSADFAQYIAECVNGWFLQRNKKKGKKK